MDTEFGREAKPASLGFFAKHVSGHYPMWRTFWVNWFIPKVAIIFPGPSAARAYDDWMLKIPTDDQAMISLGHLFFIYWNTWPGILLAWTLLTFIAINRGQRQGLQRLWLWLANIYFVFVLIIMFGGSRSELQGLLGSA